MRCRYLLAALLLFEPAAAQASGLAQLAEIARGRAARQRPAQVEALKPFLPDLGLAYRGQNRAYLDTKFDQIAALGQGISPLLLEYLTPADAGAEARNRADNVMRVLARLDPTDHTDLLIELARHSSETARRNAIILLGHSKHPSAEIALIDRIDALADPERLHVVDSLTRLESKRAVTAVAKYLGSTSLALRQRVLVYLTMFDDAHRALDAVHDAFAREASSPLLSLYVEYFKAHAKGRKDVADSLAKLAAENKLGFTEQRDLIRSLATIAPAKHAASIDALEAIVDATENAGDLEIAAAITLEALGERSGVKAIEKRLDQVVKKSRNDADAFSNRADWQRERGEWRAAIRDYESAIKFSKSTSRRSMFYLSIARCEAHRGKWTRVRSALKNSGLSRTTIEREAASDPVFVEALGKDAVRRFLEDLK